MKHVNYEYVKQDTIIFLKKLLEEVEDDRYTKERLILFLRKNDIYD